MLQWTQEGEELLMKARRYHNGAIECFKRREFSQSKKFLQNALKGRRMALPGSHPLILGTLEMLTVVSQVANNAHQLGDTISSSLMSTGHRRIGEVDIHNLANAEEDDDEEDVQHRNMDSISVSEPSSLSDSSAESELDSDSDEESSKKKISEIERRKKRSEAVNRRREREKRREEKLQNKKRDKLNRILRDASSKPKHDHQNTTTNATPMSILKMKQLGSENDRKKADPGSEQFALFTDRSGRVIDPCHAEKIINNQELQMLLEELVALQERRMGMYHVETEDTLSRLWNVLRELGDEEGASAISDRVWKMRCMSQAERRGADFDHVLSNLSVGGDDSSKIQSATAKNWQRSANVIKDHYMVRPLNPYHSSILERFDKYEEALGRKLGLIDDEPPSDNEGDGNEGATATRDNKGTIDGGGHDSSVPSPVSTTTSNPTTSASPPTDPLPKEKYTPETIDTTTTSTLHDVSNITAEESPQRSRRKWLKEIDAMSPMDMFRMLVPEGSVYDKHKAAAFQPEYVELQMAELPPPPPPPEEDDQLIPPLPSLGGEGTEGGVVVADGDAIVVDGQEVATTDPEFLSETVGPIALDALDVDGATVPTSVDQPTQLSSSTPTVPSPTDQVRPPLAPPSAASNNNTTGDVLLPALPTSTTVADDSPAPSPPASPREGGRDGSESSQLPPPSEAPTSMQPSPMPSPRGA